MPSRCVIVQMLRVGEKFVIREGSDDSEGVGFPGCGTGGGTGMIPSKKFECQVLIFGKVDQFCKCHLQVSISITK